MLLCPIRLDETVLGGGQIFFFKSDILRFLVTESYRSHFGLILKSDAISDDTLTNQIGVADHESVVKKFRRKSEHLKNFSY